MVTHNTHTDKELFRLISTGDQSAFEAFYHLYKERVYSLAFHWLKTYFNADEVTQEVFINLWIARENLGKVEQPKNYLFTIAYNQINKALRKATQQDKIREFVSYSQHDISNTTKEQLDAREINRLIDIAVEHLPPQKKLVYRMSRQQGKSNEEIAEALRISPLTVKDHLKDAIHLLRKSLSHITIIMLLLK